MGQRVIGPLGRPSPEQRRGLIVALLSLAALLGFGLGGRTLKRRRATRVSQAEDRLSASGALDALDLDELDEPDAPDAVTGEPALVDAVPALVPAGVTSGSSGGDEVAFVSMHDRAPVLESAVGHPPTVWLSLPSAESLGFRGPGAFALPGGGSVALPGATPLPGPAPSRGATHRRPGARHGELSLADLRVYVASLSWPLTIIAISGLALAMRLIGHSSNYDLFIDEITYSTIGQAVALGHGVTLYGPPFFLHPPLFFYLEGGLLDLFGGAHASPVNLVLELRPVNCVIGAIECGLLMLLVSRITHRRAAVVVGIFVACDPFLLLWDGRCCWRRWP